MTKEAGFLETLQPNVKTVSSTKVSSVTNEVKTAPSLFDSMLAGATSAQENITSSETEGKNTVDKSITAKIDIKNTKNQTQNTLNSSNETLISKTTQGGSLLEGMIQDATKEAALEDSFESKTHSITKASLPVQEVNSKDSNKTPVAEEGKKDLEQNNIKPILTTILNGDLAEEVKIKEPSSLLDKLLQEANESIKNQTQTSNKPQLEADVKIENIVTKDISKEVIQDKSATQNSVVTSANQEKENKPIQNSSANNINELKTENSSNTTLSLLDKMLQDANNQIQKETPPVLEAKEIKVVQTTQTKMVQAKEVNILEQTIIETKIHTKEIPLKEATSVETKTSLVQTQTVSPVSVNNEKVASELAKLTESSVEKIALNKDDLVSVKDNKEPAKSLMDRLLDEAKNTKVTQENSQNIKESTSVSEAANNEKAQANGVLNNIYLSSLNKASQDGFLQKTQEVKTVVANATSVKDVQTAADLFNLGFQSSEVTLDEEQFKENVKNEFLNKLSVNREIIKHDINKMSEAIVEQSKAIKNEAVLAVADNSWMSKNLPEVEVNVSSAAAYNIENKIIGARQHMNSMMSDMARNMYLNYKPPVTAFRMNLNPGNLGSIAVLIKNDKTNGLSISLNMSSVATMDSFVDNQAALRAALAKNFDTAANINLEFNMQEGKEQNSSGERNKKQQQPHRATNDILESLNNQSEMVEKVTNYM
ncbi:MAG: hypothetical protein WC141_02060 [Arcobacteraceae bacterium]